MVGQQQTDRSGPADGRDVGGEGGQEVDEAGALPQHQLQLFDLLRVHPSRCDEHDGPTTGGHRHPRPRCRHGPDQCPAQSAQLVSPTDRSALDPGLAGHQGTHPVDPSRGLRHERGPRGVRASAYEG